MLKVVLNFVQLTSIVFNLPTQSDFQLFGFLALVSNINSWNLCY